MVSYRQKLNLDSLCEALKSKDDELLSTLIDSSLPKDEEFVREGTRLQSIVSLSSKHKDETKPLSDSLEEE